MRKILVLGIAGGSGSGKTTLTKRLVERFPGHITVVGHDNYYKRHDELTYEERCLINYDEPAAFENELMSAHLDALRNGESVLCPVYDYTVHNRSDETTTIDPCPVIIVEGIFDANERGFGFVSVIIRTTAGKVKVPDTRTIRTSFEERISVSSSRNQ